MDSEHFQGPSEQWAYSQLGLFSAPGVESVLGLVVCFGLCVCIYVCKYVCGYMGGTRRTSSRSQWVLELKPSLAGMVAVPLPPSRADPFNTSLGEDALPNGLDVTFEVTELRRLTGSYNTMVGNNEGSMVRHGSVTV